MFNIFKKKEKLQKDVITKESTIDFSNPIKCEYIFSNDYVSIATEACAVCWDKPAPSLFSEKLKYLERRVKIGHTSVLEHGNIVVAFKYDTKKAPRDHEVEFLTACKYLNVNSYTSKNNTVIVVAGPIRGYHHIFDTIANSGEKQNNYFVSALIEYFYNYSYPELFVQYIDDGIMDRAKFIGVSTYNSKDEESCDSRPPIYDCIDFRIVAVDNFAEIKTALENYAYLNTASNVDIDKLALDCVSISVLFKNMSRTCTHQLVRHRNGITQESQRYVDYSKAMFSSPEHYKEKYCGSSYNVVFDGVEHHFTNLQELGDAISLIYPQLINPRMSNSVPLQREDARAFLPSNIICRKIYMTFTLRNFFKFIHLRAEAHAQAEIRAYAYAIKDWWNRSGYNDSNTFYYNEIYIKPKYVRSETDTYDKVDEEDDNIVVKLNEVPASAYDNNPLVTKEEPKE